MSSSKEKLKTNDGKAKRKFVVERSDENIPHRRS